MLHVPYDGSETKWWVLLGVIVMVYCLAGLGFLVFG